MAVLVTLFSFNFIPANGNEPEGNLVLDSAGDLIGSTSGAGNDLGSVFELAATPTGYASAPTTLGYFNGPPAGTNPNPGVVIDAAGDVIGSTRFQGVNSLGSVYEFTKTATGYSSTTVLFSFTSSTG